MLNIFQGRTFLLHGFGISNKAVSKHLPEFYVYDDNPTAIPDGIRVAADPFRLIRDGIVTDVVVTPGVSRRHPIFAEKAVFWNDISLYMTLCQPYTTVACTGSFGKSTCVSMMSHVSKMQLGGNIGMPVFDLDPNIDSILELSAQQLELCSNIPLRLSMILNLFPHHLDEYETPEEYFAAKYRIAQNCKQLIVDYDCNLSHPNKKTISTIHKSADYYFDGSVIYENGQYAGSISGVADLSFVGAYAALREIGYRAEAILAAMVSFTPLAHRCNVIQSDKIYINDSKATNLVNSAYCIKKFAHYGKVGWICGGKNQPQNLAILDTFLPIIHHAATIGSSGSILYEYMNNHGISVSKNDSIASAIASCKDCDVVILSPGYPSTDQYRNFMVRGKEFEDLAIKQDIDLIKASTF